MKKISVVVPVYNVEKFLHQCLGSLLYQTYKNLEIIIVDDGSPDNSAKIYNKYAQLDRRIVIIKQKNLGLSAARNVGLKHATGEYVHFIDSDDYLDADYYETMINGVSDTYADVIAGGVISQNGDMYNVDYKTRCVLTGISEKYLVTNALSNCTVWRYMFRREFLVSNNLQFPEGRIFEDMIFIPKAILLANTIVTIPNTYYHYVFNNNSLLNKKYTPQHQKHFKYAQQSLQSFINKNKLGYLISSKVNPVTTYRIFGINAIKKINFCNKGFTKVYLFGVRILKIFYKNQG